MDAPTTDYNIGYVDCIYFIMSKETISLLEAAIKTPVSINELRLDYTNNRIYDPDNSNVPSVPMNYGAITYSEFISFDRLIMSSMSMYSTGLAYQNHSGKSLFFPSIKEDDAIQLMMHSKLTDNIISY